MTFDCSFGLGYLPVLWSVFTIAALGVSYIMAVMQNHVYPFLPSISATGKNIPESNIFSLLMNVSLILAASNYFTRYFQCQHQARHCGDNRELIYRYNQFSLIVAITSLGGALLVANVQARREFYLLEVHEAGAVIFFACTSIYFWLQTSISYKTALYGIYSSWLCHLRSALSLVLSLCSCVYFVTASISSYNLRKHHQSYNSLASLEPSDKGYTLHVVSNASEWLAFFSIMALSLTYFEEFQQVIMLIDCQEKSPTIISYDGIGEYDEMKLNMYGDGGEEEENNN